MPDPPQAPRGAPVQANAPPAGGGAAANPIAEPEEAKPDIMAISLSSRLPEFWTDQPRVWFIRVEAILAPQKLGDDSRFDLVVAKLPKEVIVQLTDFLSRPPAANKFTALKAKLLSLFEDTRIRQIERLIGELELGESKPSQLLNRMKDLARENFPDETLRILWQGRLPVNVRGVLAVAETSDLDKLAIIADNVIEATRHSYVSEVRQPSSFGKPPCDGNASTSSQSEIALLTKQDAKLTAQMSNMERSRSRQRNQKQRRRSYGRSTSRGRSSSRGQPRRAKDDPEWLCRYHFKFGEKAQHCFQPCAWKLSGSEN
ncbi:uncharacterized protein LOC134743989 [Cydia strobilella]|uniref:uncharacterized protein LOC134743989 n=1 Tax=Cydia strobilella TaxID=1100964 RepID=UPI00300482B3